MNHMMLPLTSSMARQHSASGEQHSTTFELNGRRYILVASESLDAHPCANDRSRLDLHFEVTRDEEWASLSVTRDGHCLEFGQRMHHYCLVTLARRRVADAMAGLPESNHGWLTRDELRGMLGVDSSHLNVLIFRARQQWSTAIAVWDERSPVLEQRRGSLRLASLPFMIRRGGIVESRYCTDGDRAITRPLR